MSEINTISRGFETMIPKAREEEDPKRTPVFSWFFRLFHLEFRVTIDALSDRSEIQ